MEYFSMENQFHGKISWLEYICLLSCQHLENTYNQQFHTSIAMLQVQCQHMPLTAQHRALGRFHSQQKTNQLLSQSSSRREPTLSLTCANQHQLLDQSCSRDPNRAFHTIPLGHTDTPMLVLNTWVETKHVTLSLLMVLLCFTVKADPDRMTQT